jgi:hypothetical protein
VRRGVFGVIEGEGVTTTIKLPWKWNNSLLVGPNLINSGSSDATGSWSFDFIPVTCTAIVL